MQWNFRMFIGMIIPTHVVNAVLNLEEYLAPFSSFGVYRLISPSQSMFWTYPKDWRFDYLFIWIHNARNVFVDVSMPLLVRASGFPWVPYLHPMQHRLPAPCACWQGGVANSFVRAYAHSRGVGYPSWQKPIPFITHHIARQYAVCEAPCHEYYL